jgi:hypothetical protein
MTKIRYCQHCGEKMIDSIEHASKFVRPTKIYTYTVFKYDKFDRSTGARIFIRVVTCPKRSKFFPSNHERYAVGKPFVTDPKTGKLSFKLNF